MKKAIKIILGIFAFAFLTAVTQIGGVVYLISLLLSRKIKPKVPFKSLLVFVALYLMSTYFIVPNLAPLFGREPVTHAQGISPANAMTIVLNRNYVRSEVNTLLLNTSEIAAKQGVSIVYLDANFPFFDGFPLLPHLSHNDGRKIDLGLVYHDQNNKVIPNQKSRSGYGVFEGPKPGEVNQTEICKSAGYHQYDYSKYFGFGKINSELKFSESGTRALVNALLTSELVEKIFIEPHLTQRLELNDSRIRFHGCGSVRHDDHIHVQIR